MLRVERVFEGAAEDQGFSFAWPKVETRVAGWEEPCHPGPCMRAPR
jgi:hypothetical protein